MTAHTRTTAHTLNAVPEIALGADRIDRVGEDVTAFGGDAATVLLLADPGLARFGMTDRVAAAIRAAGHAVTLFDDVKSDPLSRQIDDACRVARDADAGVVVALGGGSALDVAKVVAAITRADRPSEHFQLCNTPLPVNGMPCICVPTTAGTGSETTATSIFTNAAGQKVWVWGPELKADRVILDPTLTVAMPPSLTAATGIDALVHAIEAATNRNAFAANTFYCHEAIRLIVRHLPRAVADPGDLEARQAMLLAAAYAGIGIDNAGTAIAHAIAHALAVLMPIHHGRAAGLGMLATLSWCVEENRDAYAAVAEAMGEPRDAASLPPAFERLLRGVGVTVSLAGDPNGKVAPNVLAARMADPENAPMRRATVRTVEDADLARFAAAVLTAE